ncbi:MAG: hypothetical protein ACREV3_07990, partial [Gammaproteobacteria bacterium]
PYHNIIVYSGEVWGKEPHAHKLWRSERLEDKRAVLKLTFPTVWPMCETRDFEPEKPPYLSGS